MKDYAQIQAANALRNDIAARLEKLSLIREAGEKMLGELEETAVDSDIERGRKAYRNGKVRDALTSQLKIENRELKIAKDKLEVIDANIRGNLTVEDVTYWIAELRREVFGEGE